MDCQVFERRVVKNASVIFAVSDGNKKQLLKDYPFLEKGRLIGVPYGGEIKDFTYFSAVSKDSKAQHLIRYIDGVGPDMHESRCSITGHKNRLKKILSGLNLLAPPMRRPPGMNHSLNH